MRLQHYDKIFYLPLSDGESVAKLWENVSWLPRKPLLRSLPLKLLRSQLRRRRSNLRGASLTPATKRRISVGAGAAVVLMVAVLGAHRAEAASLANRDDRDHKIRIIEGETGADQILKPQQALEGICAKGCIIRLNDSEDDEYQLEATDVVSIEDGYLYYDTPDSAAPAQPGTAPAQKK
jgi:hypothetical protein